MRKQGLSKKIIIGVTGIFGSGKSTVSRIFKAHGSTIIDADKIARRYLSPETKTFDVLPSSELRCSAECPQAPASIPDVAWQAATKIWRTKLHQECGLLHLDLV